MADTLVTIHALTRESLEDLFSLLQEGERPLPHPSAVSCKDIDSEDLLEFTIAWRDIQPLTLALAFASAYQSIKFPDEVDPNIMIGGDDGFAGKYLAGVIETQRLKLQLDRQTKRTNVLAKELISVKQVISDTNDLTGDMYMQHTVALKAVMHMNQQLSSLGAEPFDFSSVHINKH